CCVLVNLYAVAEVSARLGPVPDALGSPRFVFGQVIDVGSGETDHPTARGRFLLLSTGSRRVLRFLHTGRVGGFPTRPLRSLSQRW
ncbi:unnamed protein product, partial [Musa textilis]